MVSLFVRQLISHFIKFFFPFRTNSNKNVNQTMSTDVRSQNSKSTSESDEPIVKKRASNARRYNITPVTISSTNYFYAFYRIISDCDSFSEGNATVERSASNKRTKKRALKRKRQKERLKQSKEVSAVQSTSKSKGFCYLYAFTFTNEQYLRVLSFIFFRPTCFKEA